MTTKRESPLYNAARLLASKHGARLFRNNVGLAFDASGNPIHFGLCTGSSDLIGWCPVTIRPEHVGETVAVFLAVEAKGPRTATTPEQIDFLTAVANAGGIALLIRGTTDDLGRILEQAQRGEKPWGVPHGPMPRTRRQTK